MYIRKRAWWMEAQFMRTYVLAHDVAIAAALAATELFCLFQQVSIYNSSPLIILLRLRLLLLLLPLTLLLLLPLRLKLPTRLVPLLLLVRPILPLLHLELLRLDHIPPLILPRVPLMVDLLVDNMLVRGVIRVYNPHRLPPALPLPLITNLEDRRGDQYRHRQPLRVHSSLHKLLLSAEVGVPADETEGEGHAGDPAGADDGVAVLFAPVHEALIGGFLGVAFCALAGGFVFVAFVWVAGGLEGAGEVVGCYDCCVEEGQSASRFVLRGMMLAYLFFYLLSIFFVRDLG